MHTTGLLPTIFLILLAPTQAFVVPTSSRRHLQDTTGNALSNGTHLQPEEYTFPARDGWMQYQIRDVLDFSASPPDKTAIDEPNSESRRTFSDIEPRKSTSKSTKTKTSGKSLGGAISGALKGIGDAIGVVITWYTGHDLENPSCWDKSVWTPTDDSHICAVTLNGWTDKPKCFDFLELCAGKKCVFVRVIDTCAGCAAGSKHVDLSKSAFTALGSLDTGTMNVQMRKATKPKTWNSKLYGPKA